MHRGRKGSERQILGLNLLVPSIVKQELLHLGFVVLIQRRRAFLDHFHLLHANGAQSRSLSLELAPL